MWQSTAKAHARPRTILEAVQTFAPTRNGFEIAQKAALARPTITFKALSVDTSRRELTAIISRANFIDSQGDCIERSALEAGCADLNARGVGKCAVDRNHRDSLTDVVLEKAFMGSPALPAPYNDPDCLYGQFAFANPSPTWDGIRAGRCVGMSWAGPFAR